MNSLIFQIQLNIFCQSQRLKSQSILTIIWVNLLSIGIISLIPKETQGQILPDSTLPQSSQIIHKGNQIIMALLD